MAHFGIGTCTESQPYNTFGRQHHQQTRTGTASPMLSQPLAGTQRSTAGLQLKSNSGCSLLQHSNFSQLGPISQQQAYSSRAGSGFGVSQHQPALSGVFRPGSAPQASQWDVVPASQLSQQGATGLGVGLSPRNSEPLGHANGGLLRPKQVSLLRGPAVNSSNSLAGQLQNRPGSAPGLLSVAAPPSMHQHRPAGSLLGPNQRNQQHTTMQQQRGPSGMGLASAINSSQQQQALQSIIISGSQQKYEQYDLGHASQGLVPGLEFDSTGGTETAAAPALLESQQQKQVPQGTQQPHHLFQLLPLGATVGTPGIMRGGSGAAGVLQGEGNGARWHQEDATASPVVQTKTSAAAAATAHADEAPHANPGKTAATDTCTIQAAAVQQVNAAAAAAAAVSAANVDLVQRISSLEECCNCMSSIVKRDIPTLLQQQNTTQDRLQTLADNSNSNHSALEARMEVLASSVASFMDGFKAWQQEQQLLQQQREAEQLQQQAAVDLSSVACQTTPGVLGSQPRDVAASARDRVASATAAAEAAAAGMDMARASHLTAVTSPTATRFNRNKPNPHVPVLAAQHGYTASPLASPGHGSGCQHAGNPFDGYAGLEGSPTSPILPAAAVEPFAVPTACAASGLAPVAAADDSEQANPSGTSRDVAEAPAPTTHAAVRRGGKAGARKKTPVAAKHTVSKSKQADGLVQTKITHSGRPATRRAVAAAAAAAAEHAEAAAAAKQKNASAAAHAAIRATAAVAAKDSASVELAADVPQSPTNTCTAPALSVPNGTAGRRPLAPAPAAAGSIALPKTVTAEEAANATGATSFTPWLTKHSSGSSSSKHPGDSEQQIKHQQKAPARPVMPSRQGVKSRGRTTVASAELPVSAAAGGRACRPVSMTHQQHCCSEQTQQLFQVQQQQQQHTVEREFQRHPSGGAGAAAFAAGQSQQVAPAARLPPAPLQGRKVAAAADVSAFGPAASGVPDQAVAGVFTGRVSMMPTSEASRPTRSTVSVFAAAAEGAGVTARPASSGAGGAAVSRAGTTAVSGPMGSMFQAGTSRPGAAASLKRSRSLVCAPRPPTSAAPAAAPKVAASRPASSSALMLFGEMDSDSLDGVIDSQDTENQANQNTAPRFSLFDSTTAAAVRGLSAGFAGVSDGVHCCRGMNRSAATAGTADHQTATTTAAAARAVPAPGAQSDGGAAATLRPAARSTALPANMLIDDDDLAQQVAARMARHRSKRLRSMRSTSQM